MTHTPPHYVYCAMLMNYRDANQWYVIRASDAPLRDVRGIWNSAINRHGTSRRVLWCVPCQNAQVVADAVNEWLKARPDIQRAGIGTVSYLLGYEDVDVALARAKEEAQKIFDAGRTNAP